MVSIKVYLLLNLLVLLAVVECKKFDDKEKPKWAKKDIRDYNEADLERLLDQWEVKFLNICKIMTWYSLTYLFFRKMMSH